jgi:hypothetical protein
MDMACGFRRDGWFMIKKSGHKYSPNKGDLIFFTANNTSVYEIFSWELHEVFSAVF